MDQRTATITICAETPETWTLSIARDPLGEPRPLGSVFEGPLGFEVGGQSYRTLTDAGNEVIRRLRTDPELQERLNLAGVEFYYLEGPDGQV
jgi:hypothetical protein